MVAICNRKTGEGGGRGILIASDMFEDGLFYGGWGLFSEVWRML